MAKNEEKNGEKSKIHIENHRDTEEITEGHHGYYEPNAEMI